MSRGAVWKLTIYCILFFLEFLIIRSIEEKGHLSILLHLIPRTRAMSLSPRPLWIGLVWGCCLAPSWRSPCPSSDSLDTTTQCMVKERKKDLKLRLPGFKPWFCYSISCETLGHTFKFSMPSLSVKWSILSHGIFFN